jgi:predicted transcriptional regulator of viral defense system
MRDGVLIRVGRGLYAPSSLEPGKEPDALSQLAIQYPGAVYCLLTALQIHGLTTQSPHEVWVAISQKAKAPKVNYPPLRIMRFGDLLLGVTQVSVDGIVQIPVTSAAKTVVDCFKFRSKVGLDVALEALREAWRQRKVTMDELWEMANNCRMANVMRPYLESLV